jgi:hypothetical protein
MSNTVSIRFEIDCGVRRRSGGKVGWSYEYVEGICNYIPSNGRRNCQGNFASYELGEIILNSRSVLKRRNGLIIELDVTCEKMVADNIEDIKEIIWAIMPSCYSDSESDIFTFNKSGSESNNYYKLVIEDVPQNITYELLDLTG